MVVFSKKIVPLSIMGKINSYIRDLLILHDCVIIPDFGGFVGNYESAVVTDKDYFIPPRKSVAFNPQLKNNDGLLANTIADIENVSYEQAMEQIHAYTSSIQKALKATGEFTLDAVGTLRQSAERTLVFEPNATSNFLAAPVGMDAFHMTPTALNLNIPKEIPQEKSRMFPVLKRILVAGVSGFALLSLALNPNNTETPGLASLAPSFTMEATPAPAPLQKPETVEAPLESSNVEEVVAEKIEAVPEVIKNYHVMVGCFSSAQNAEKQKTLFEADNMSSRTFRYSRGLTGVSVGDFETFGEAKVLMNKLRNSGKAPSAWILKRKI